MDAAERWLRANDPEYKKDRAIRQRKQMKKEKAIADGNLNRSSTPRQMRGVVKENLGGKTIDTPRNIRPNRPKRCRGKRNSARRAGAKA